MDNKDNLTWQEIGAQAIRMGHQDVADWIMEEQGRREQARDDAKNRPLVTPVGTLIPGHSYNLTMKPRPRSNRTSYGDTRRKNIKNVTYDRWTPSIGRLRYPSGKTATYLYSSGDIARIESIEAAD